MVLGSNTALSFWALPPQHMPFLNLHFAISQLSPANIGGLRRTPLTLFCVVPKRAQGWGPAIRWEARKRPLSSGRATCAPATWPKLPDHSQTQRRKRQGITGNWKAVLSVIYLGVGVGRRSVGGRSKFRETFQNVLLCNLRQITEPL